jgi:hypothetical protein
MTRAQFDRLDEREAGDILCWRFSSLMRLGLGLIDAVELATHIEIDLHAAERLLQRGCPPQTAIRILA